MNATDPVLLVEDSEDDVFFFRRAWEQAQIANPLLVARDGQEAIDKLRDGAPAEAFGGRPGERIRPGLVLLDLKLPFRNGHEVLAWIRSQPESRRCVVLFLTSSREASDVRRAYEAGANGYLVKPGSGAQLAAMVRAFKSYWLEFNVA